MKVPFFGFCENTDTLLGIWLIWGNSYSAENNNSCRQAWLLLVAASCREPHVGVSTLWMWPRRVTRRKHETVSWEFLSDPELFCSVLMVYLHYFEMHMNFGVLTIVTYGPDGGETDKTARLNTGTLNTDPRGRPLLCGPPQRGCLWKDKLPGTTKNHVGNTRKSFSGTRIPLILKGSSLSFPLLAAWINCGRLIF